jgi:hypothetical protein
MIIHKWSWSDRSELVPTTDVKTDPMGTRGGITRKEYKWGGTRGRIPGRGRSHDCKDTLTLSLFRRDSSNSQSGCNIDGKNPLSLTFTGHCRAVPWADQRGVKVPMTPLNI